MADGDLPVPGSAGPRHAVPAGHHVAAVHCELAQLEGVQLRSGTVVLPVPASLSSRVWALTGLCKQLPSMNHLGFRNLCDRTAPSHAGACPSLEGSPTSPDKGAAGQARPQDIRGSQV